MALVLYSCGGEVLCIWSSLAIAKLFEHTLGCSLLVPLKIKKKCLGIVLDNFMGDC